MRAFKVMREVKYCKLTAQLVSNECSFICLNAVKSDFFAVF